MNDYPTVVLTIVGFAATYTVSIALFSWWLSAQFRRMEGLIYRLIERQNHKFDHITREHAGRILKLEIRAFGFGPTIESSPPQDFPPE